MSIHIPGMAARFLVYGFIYTVALFLISNTLGGVVTAFELILCFLVAGLVVFWGRPVVIDMEAQDAAQFVEDAKSALLDMGYQLVGERENRVLFMRRFLLGLFQDYMLLERDGKTVLVSGFKRDMRRMADRIEATRSSNLV